MKLIISILSISLITGIGYAPDLNYKKKNDKAIELSFFATVGSNITSNYQVLVSEDNSSTDTLIITKSRTVFVQLEANHVYAFRFIKKGYLERLLVVNTYLPAESEDLYSFDFEIEMIRQPLVKTNNPWLVFPVAIVTYQNDKEEFDYNKDYQSFIRNKQGINQ